MTEEIEGEKIDTQVAVEETNLGEDTQDATEEKNVSSNNDHWSRARETMRSQSEEIKRLKQIVESNQNPKAKYNGKDADDLTTFEDIDAYFSKQRKDIDTKFAMLEAKSLYSDYDNVIAKYGDSLPKVLVDGILKSENPHIAAYEACKLVAEKDKLQNTVSDSAKRVKENLNKVGSASSVGNSGTLSAAKKYENMSLEDVLAHSNKVLGR